MKQISSGSILYLLESGLGLDQAFPFQLGSICFLIVSRLVLESLLLTTPHLTISHSSLLATQIKIYS